MKEFNRLFSGKAFTLLLVILTMSNVKSAILVIEGKYQNKNIFIQNGYSATGVGFCTREVRVNGQITTDEVNSSSFEIDLRALHLKFGQNVLIEIVHNEGCMPKVLNMEDLKPKPSFELTSISVSPDGLLTWSTKNEQGVLPFIIEQFKWNKWVPVGELDGNGTPGAQKYSFQVAMHSGENKYRIKQKGFNSFVKVSKEVTVASNVSKPSFNIPKSHNKIDFSSETAYEIYDAYGVIVKRGYGREVELQNLGKGEYYLCYDNSLAEFKK